MSLQLDLFPRPRSAEVAGPGPGPGATARESIDEALPAQGFELRADRGGIELRAADDAGRRYGRHVVEQLDAQFPGGWPGLEVRDAPDFPVRGYLLDVSRTRVPTRETLAAIVDWMDRLRLNHLQLYTEHTFAYRDHETVWADASPITPEDVRWLDALCDARGIELVPNQNAFGHMGRWLKHPAYRDRAEAPDGWSAPWGGEMPPGVLEPTAENAAFVLELFRELLGNFTSRRVNINCDETFELGQGRSRAAVDARGAGRVYAEFLTRLLEPLIAEGREVLFWGDVVRQHPEVVPDLPKTNVIGLAWHYEAPLEGELEVSDSARSLFAAAGIDEEALRGFEAHARPFAACAFPFWVCPGTSAWNTTTGRLPNAIGNLRDAAEVGLRRGAGGFLITDWGDNGHMAPPAISLAALAYGAGVGWCGLSNRDVDLAGVLDRHVFRDGAGEIGAALVALGSAFSRTGLHTPNGSPLQYALIGRGGLGRFSSGVASERGIADTVELLEDCERRLVRARPVDPTHATSPREIAQAARLARHGAWTLARERDLARPDDTELARDLDACIAEQSACWRLRSRPGGLEESLRPLRKLRDRYGG